MKLENSVALVTGANRGIGRSFVHALFAAGAKKVYAAARSLDTLEWVRADPRIVAVKLDVTRDDDFRDLAAKASDITLLVNNAGVLDFGSVLEAELQAFERNFATNFYGVLASSRTFAPVIEKNGGGAIVNMHTVLALASMPGFGVYNASKAAAWSLTQSLRAGLASRGVSVHAVFPGPVDTEMLKAVPVPKTSPDDVAKAVLQGVERGDEDIFPDPMSVSLYQAWRNDHKAVEKQFAAM